MLETPSFCVEGVDSVPGTALAGELQTLFAGAAPGMYLAKVDGQAVTEFIRAGGAYIGTELVLARAPQTPLLEPAEDVGVSFSSSCDPEPFLELAQDMGFSRFFLDPAIAPAKAVALWRESIANHCGGLATELAVAQVDGQPAGLVTLHCSPGQPVRMGIVGVRAAFRGRGVGRALMAAIAARYGERPIHVEVFSSNTAAVRLYQRSGFNFNSLRHVLHIWHTGRTLAAGANSSRSLETVSC